MTSSLLGLIDMLMSSVRAPVGGGKTSVVTPSAARRIDACSGREHLATRERGPTGLPEGVAT